MSCAVSVKRSLTTVVGVAKADVSFEKKEAVVTFDDAKANVAALLKATEKVGYKSSVKN